LEKRPSLLKRWRCSCKFKSRRIGTWINPTEQCHATKIHVACKYTINDAPQPRHRQRGLGHEHPRRDGDVGRDDVLDGVGVGGGDGDWRLPLVVDLHRIDFMNKFLAKCFRVNFKLLNHELEYKTLVKI
jgi:hypothetical protein